VAILHHHGRLTPEQVERINAVMGDLSYGLVEVIRDPDGTTRRVDDGRVVGRPL
jgi:hypothetical protein